MLVCRTMALEYNRRIESAFRASEIQFKIAGVLIAFVYVFRQRLLDDLRYA
jgi:hypothetical protein